MKTPPFNQLIRQSQTHVLADFSAKCFGSCQTMGPIIADVSQTLSGKLHVLEINVNLYRALAEGFNIKCVSTLTLFNRAEIVKRKTELLTKKELITHINHTIN